MENQQSSTLTTEPIELVRSDGTLLGSPLHPPPAPHNHGRTALVTGATGVSEYIFHMVKLLASSERWAKVYCLSRRPPPPTLFVDLGENAAKVECMDFLGITEITPRDLRGLAMVKNHLDYVFYFSYMQPLPTDRYSSLWYDVEEINTVNITMLVSFLAALHRSGLKVKRFVHQTVLKHYGHGSSLELAAYPTAGSDRRGTLTELFYQAQEHNVAKYCQSACCRLTVTRPPWTMGVIPDSQLHHPLGTGINAAVQAHPRQPLPLPGDHHALEREQVERIATLNTHFEEWLILSENTTSHSLNIHNGQSPT